MATKYQEYAASSNLTVTNLHSLAASAGLLGGWTSGTIDNTTTKYDEFALTLKLVRAAANLQAGSIQVWAYAMLDDTTWPDIFSSGTEGTEGAATIHDDEQKTELMLPVWSTTADTGVSEPHNMPWIGSRGVFRGVQPAKFALWITGNIATGTNAMFAASGNQVTIKGLYNTIS